MPIHLDPNFVWRHALGNDFDVRPFLRAADAGLAAADLSYRLKAAVAELCRPGRVLALGCGAGYEVAALLSGTPQSCCVAVGRGGEPFGHARATLPDRYPDADLRFVEVDPRRDATPWLRPLLAEGAFDLVFVSGGPGRAGCVDDLRAAYWAVHSGGFILVDGYDDCRGVWAAVQDFLFAASMPHLYFCTARGDVLINVHKK